MGCGTRARARYFLPLVVQSTNSLGYRETSNPDPILSADGEKAADNTVDLRQGKEALTNRRLTKLKKRPNLFLLCIYGGAGAVKVVQSACAIGEALENEVKIHRLLEKTSKKSIAIKKPEAESDTMTNEQETLTTELEQEKLTKEQRPSYIVYQITKMKKIQQVQEILKEQDDLKPWGQEAHVKTTLTALGEMFEAAGSIMSWIGECAKVFGALSLLDCWQ
ncbi:hypothetical protein M0R45_005943 [Rubus argutus]|uniref:DNA-directed RNA polymerase C-terminal domain-containing protein n=1 Tax=Rubus argutus TaxID=59490 RepID=A0AAW1YPI7_RUBAR